MTDVLVDLAVRAPGGALNPAKGTVYVVPTVRGRDGTHVVLRQEYGQVLVDGVTTFTLQPGTWRFREDVPAGGGLVRTVVVPDSTDTVNYGDLVDA